MTEKTPSCPKCGQDDMVKAITGCRCLSCPPWICHRCEFYRGGPKGYEFWDDEDDE